MESLLTSFLVVVIIIVGLDHKHCLRREQKFSVPKFLDKMCSTDTDTIVGCLLAQLECLKNSFIGQRLFAK